MAPRPFDAVLENWRERVHPEDWFALLEVVQKCIDGQALCFCSEHQGLSPDGSWRWVQCQGVVFGRDEDGKVTRMIGTDSNIHARKHVEEELREVGSIQQAVFGSLPQYLAVLDAEGRVLSTNAVWDAYALTVGHAYLDGFVRSDYAQLLDAVTGGAEQTKRAAPAAIADLIAGKVSRFQFGYSFLTGTEKRWFIMNVIAVRGGRARAVVSHQDVTCIKGPVDAPLSQGGVVEPS